MADNLHDRLLLPCVTFAEIQFPAGMKYDFSEAISPPVVQAGEP